MRQRRRQRRDWNGGSIGDDDGDNIFVHRRIVALEVSVRLSYHNTRTRASTTTGEYSFVRIQCYYDYCCLQVTTRIVRVSGDRDNKSHLPAVLGGGACHHWQLPFPKRKAFVCRRRMNARENPRAGWRNWQYQRSLVGWCDRRERSLVGWCDRRAGSTIVRAMPVEKFSSFIWQK